MSEGRSSLPPTAERQTEDRRLHVVSVMVADEAPPLLSIRHCFRHDRRYAIASAMIVDIEIDGGRSSLPPTAKRQTEDRRNAQFNDMAVKLHQNAQFNDMAVKLHQNAQFNDMAVKLHQNAQFNDMTVKLHQNAQFNDMAVI
uniref:Uncharacterized protein n=1 Tax=Ananas comosus var. bracteatus TaxID=296719 RepID=A0A6V7P1X0_ANACO|nr:unnamed protein product [Ananas comosus var. bracteatus]